MNYQKGNWVLTEYGEVQIKHVVFDDYQVIGKDGRLLWPNKVEPIPLTEEWLVKLGFTYLDDDKEFLAHPVLIGALKLNSDSSDCFKTCTLRIHKYLTIGVQYVDQLQNLYSALTGEELLCN